MELKTELLDKENEKIISKLDNTPGISKNKDVLRNIIKFSEVMKKEKEKNTFNNYNIIIRNKSSYNLYEDLISIIAEIYYKNEIIPNKSILYLERKAFKFGKLENENIEESIIVIDPDIANGMMSDMKKIVEKIVKTLPNKVFIVIERFFCEGEINAQLNEHFLWSMKIDEISENEKQQYVKNFLKQNDLLCSNKEIIEELANNPYYVIKNNIVNILVESKLKNEKDIAVILNKEKNKKENKKKKEAKAMEELKDLTGLNEVKEQVEKIVNFVRLSKTRNNMPMLHMCFNGNPGTGKTTIARLVGKVFAEEKILSDDNKFVEIHGRDLIGKYVGWTANQTKDQIKKAEGGVLFIDEAYSLISDESGGFEQEAIATLLKEMEDKRDKICVILAGYENRMEELLEMNPGFKSRIQFTIDFPDYSEEELYSIFKSLCRNEKYLLTANIKPILLECFKQARKDYNFSNGRFVRSLFEKIKIEQANRVVKNNNKNKNLIIKSDVINVIQDIQIKEKKVKRRIGFCA